MKSDRDLLAEWAGEELVASAQAAADARAAHRARNRFYLEILRGTSERPPLRSQSAARR